VGKQHGCRLYLCSHYFIQNRMIQERALADIACRHERAAGVGYHGRGAVQPDQHAAGHHAPGGPRRRRVVVWPPARREEARVDGVDDGLKLCRRMSRKAMPPTRTSIFVP
jgi:hypothetical protein